MIWVAEIGSMHKGDLSLAFELIRQAKEAGATIAKFQFWDDEAQAKYAGNVNPIRNLAMDNAEQLAAWCRHFNIEFMASVWSEQGIEVAKRAEMKRYKVAHALKDDTEFVAKVLRTGYETFVSGRLFEGINFWNPRSVWCISKYPTYPQDLHLPQRFLRDEWYGYSDHSHGIEACLLAVARGAQYIEKHFCLDKTDLSVRDTPFSATPQEFAELVRIGNGIARVRNASI